MQDVDGSPGENEAAKAAEEASLNADDTDYVPEAGVLQDSTNPGSDPSTALASGCIVGVVIEASEAALMEEVGSNQSLGHVAADAESFSVPEVTQLVSEAYEATMDMEGIVENLSDKT